MEMDTVPIHTRTRSTLSDKVVHWGILQERMMLIFMNIMSMAAEGTIIVAIDKISSSSSNSNSNIKVVINSTVVNLLQGKCYFSRRIMIRVQYHFYFLQKQPSLTHTFVMPPISIPFLVLFNIVHVHTSPHEINRQQSASQGNDGGYHQSQNQRAMYKSTPNQNKHKSKKSSSDSFSPTTVSADISNGSAHTPPPRHVKRLSADDNNELWYQKWWMCGFTDAFSS